MAFRCRDRKDFDFERGCSKSPWVLLANSKYNWSKFITHNTAKKAVKVERSGDPESGYPENNVTALRKQLIESAF